MADLKQNADGSVSIIRERDSLDVGRMGGYAPGALNTASTQMAFSGDTMMITQIAPATTTGMDNVTNGMLLWQNTLGYDFLVNGLTLDVTTGSASGCSATFGSSTSSTGSSTNLMSTRSVGTIGVFAGTGTVKVLQSQFLVGSLVGTSSGVALRAAFSIIPLPPPGSA